MDISDFRMNNFPCYIQDSGKLPESVGARVRDLLKSLAGKKIYITIKEESDKTSSNQRKYYFAVIVGEFIKHFASKEQYFDKNQMHDSLMRAVGGFSNPYVNPLTGEPDSGRISYNDLTKAQAEGYHTLCIQEAAKRGFQIPLPNEDLSSYGL